MAKMYYVVHKNKDGVYLLDKSQSLLYKSHDIEKTFAYWKSVIKEHDKVGKLYLVWAAKDSTDKQLLTVVRQH